MPTEPVRVLVTAIGGGGHGEQILKALRQARPPYWIAGADAQPNCPQFAWVDAHTVLPLASDPGYIDAVLALCAQHRIQAVFHGCEPELKRMSEARDRFREAGILLPINDASTISLCMDKEATNARLAELGFTPPRYVKVRSPADLDGIDWFPVVVKPSLGGGGSANCFIAQNADALSALARYIGFEALGSHFIVQEYVGTPEDEYTVGVLHDLEGNFINSIAVHRLLSGGLNVRVSVANMTERTDLGSKLVISSGVSHGWVGRYPEVTAQCEAIARAIGAKGAVNIQCRFVDGVVRVFEINPRFSGTTSIRAMMGYNEPDVLIRKHILGEPIQTGFTYQEGLVLRGLTEYCIPPSPKVAAL